ncbi:MAG: hypothetical protein JW936_04625 [Sedimentisphaerales bacterium]|nr:hypothetical protein [Sedimentisphaerales bacterium]
MNLPQLDNADKYVGLYVVDFAEAREGCAVGYTAEEIATLLESQEFGDIKVYKIHNARSDGTLELAGVSNERFQLESGMFFHCFDDETGRGDYDRVLGWAKQAPTPCRAKLQLAQDEGGQVLLALIYPAEYEEEIGQWLAASGFRGQGAVDAGISQTQSYYEQEYTLLQQEQLWPRESLEPRDQQTLLAAVGDTVQR